MERAKVVEDEIVEQNLHYLVVYVETKNSCLILLSEHEDKLGTLVVGVPQPKGMLGTPTSSVILGDRNTFLARMFAEYVAAIKHKIAVVSIYLETISEAQAQPVFKKLIERIIQSEAKRESEGLAT